MKILIVEPGKHPYEAEINSSLESLQKTVGGYIEAIYPFEDMVADYIRETDNHVLYRVTPIYDGNNMLASGVQMEAASVEDNGGGIWYNVYVYNVQPGIDIDYRTGENKEAADYEKYR